jgi:hypothetical protein
MGLLSTLDRHTDLINRMAETLQVDLGDALINGRLPPEGLRAAVLSCTACEGAGECPGWLDSHAEAASHAPGYCRNADLFERLGG